MTLQPLLQAPVFVQVHAFLALTAVGLGAVQFLAPKGTIPHRAVGYVWVTLMGAMLLAAFANHDIFAYGIFSPKICSHGKFTCASIHILTVGTFLALPYAVLHARHGNIVYHRAMMFGLFMIVLVLGTILTTIPHRRMHAVVFGEATTEQQQQLPALKPISE
jgi:uncharacterized membrane protein